MRSAWCRRSGSRRWRRSTPPSEREIKRLEHTGRGPLAGPDGLPDGARGTADVPDGCSLLSLLQRPQLHYAELAPFDPGAATTCLPEMAEQVEISVKYEGYIKRQLQQVAEFKRLESHQLPPDMDYSAHSGSAAGGPGKAFRRAAHGSGTGVPNLRRQPRRPDGADDLAGKLTLKEGYTCENC